VHLARAGSSGLASSTVAMKHQSAFGSSGLERIGLEQCGIEASKLDWLERARAECLRERSEKCEKARKESSCLGPTSQVSDGFSGLWPSSQISKRSVSWANEPSLQEVRFLRQRAKSHEFSGLGSSLQGARVLEPEAIVPGCTYVKAQTHRE
jgi:hypothetical protein